MLNRAPDKLKFCIITGNCLSRGAEHMEFGAVLFMANGVERPVLFGTRGLTILCFFFVDRLTDRFLSGFNLSIYTL